MVPKANLLVRLWKWISTLGWHGAKYAESKFFDEFIYGTVSACAITKFGTELGTYVTFLIMAPLSAALCLVYMFLYNKNEGDLFGFEKAQEIRDAVAAGRWERFLRRVMQWGDIPAFIVLNCFLPNGDPFMATVYLRKEADKFKRFTRRDWDIFGASVLVSNAYWTVRWTIIIVFFAKLLWPMFIKPALQWFGFN